jgi:transcriptional regulator with XRE-family HTH domain
VSAPSPRRLFLGHLLLALRQDRSLSHTGLAYRLYEHTGREYKPAMVGRWEKGKATPTINDCCAVSEILGCSLDDLCGPGPDGAAGGGPAASAAGAAAHARPRSRGRRSRP